MIEGLTFLVEFENEESFQPFFEMYGGQEDIHITDLEDETIKKKITIYKRVKDVPIFSSSYLSLKMMHDFGLKTSFQTFDSFVRCTLMKNQPWSQFQNGIWER